MKCNDRGMGLPLQWGSGSLTLEETHDFVGVETGDKLPWRGITITIITPCPNLLFEEVKDE